MLVYIKQSSCHSNNFAVIPHLVYTVARGLAMSNNEKLVLLLIFQFRLQALRITCLRFIVIFESMTTPS
jgi:hypothetical protein